MVHESRALLCLLLALSTSSVLANEDRAQLLAEVEALPMCGVPGPVSVFGEQAFAVLTGSEHGSPQAVVAAARFGAGRAVAFGHSGYLGDLGGQLLTNAVRWAAQKDEPTVGWLGGRLAQFKDGRRRLNDKLTGLAEVDVLVWSGDVDASACDALVAYVKAGGGLVTAVCPWGTQQVERRTRPFDLRDDLLQNRVLRPMGLVYADGYLEETGASGFLVSASQPDLVHAGQALEALQGAKLNARSKARLRSVETAIRSMPSSDTAFLDEVAKAVGELEHGPTAKTPLRDPLPRLSATLAFHRWQEASPDEVPVAAGSEVFPGAVPAEAERVKRSLTLDGATPGWHSTGLYVPPGEVVEIKRGAAGADWTARVGCHSDRLWGKATWRRWPEVSRTWTLEQETVEVASPFGGLLYFEPHAGGALEVEVTGVVEAPLYVLDSTSPAAWAKLREAPGPWAELCTEGLILSVPSASVRDLEDPEPLMRWWKEVFDCYARLSQRPAPKRPERFVADEQISAGYMHSGYPIMTWLDVATPKDGRPAFVLDLETLKAKGSWGHFHELGHNHQVSDWTFAGTGEVTCNLFSLFVMNEVVGVEPWEHPWLAGHKPKAVKHLAEGAPFAAWKSKPGLALVSYAELQRAFGWDAFKAVFRAYAALPESERPRNDADRRDQWLIRFSRVVKRDLSPFFEKWGIPTSQGARDQLSDLEPWPPLGN